MAKVSKRTDHRANRLLAALAPGDFDCLSPHLEFVDAPAGKVLYEPGARVSHAYFPHSCIISLVAVLEDGGTAEVAVFGCEGVCGYLSALVSGRAYGLYVVQLAGTASRIETERVHQLVRERPPVRQMFNAYMEALLVQSFQAIACNARHSVEARCCRWLLAIRDRLGGDSLNLTHEFLAEMLGVQRSTVSIVLRTLQTANLINQRRGVVTLIDRAALEEAACECYRVNRQSFERLLPHTYPERRTRGC